MALCDVDDRRGAGIFRAFPKATRYKDFRVMLEQEKDIDAVTVSTPDHTHAVMASMAMKMGKHVFCQKPLTRTLWEVGELKRIAKETGVTTQMGNQGHAQDGTRQIREIVEAGLIGDVHEVRFWTDRPIWPQAINRPSNLHWTPSSLDWDLWLGPAPHRPYNPDYAPFNWRGWWDFGTGALGDIACHAMDAAFWTLDLKNPTRIEAETTTLFPESPPATSRITYNFPATDKRSAIKAVWYDGNIQPARPTEMAGARFEGIMETNGQMFIGDKGILVADWLGEAARLYPDALNEEVLANPPAEKYARTNGVYLEWIEACKAGMQPGSNILDHSGPLTEMVLLGNLAVRSGEVIEWDSETMQVTNVTGPNAYLWEEYRDGWTL